ncbi:MAG: hypothetical protein ACM3H8_14350 [Sphingobacteriales bacterium]
MKKTPILLLVLYLFATLFSNAQMITGVWRGKISGNSGILKSSYKLELKLVQNGDSLTGTSYYYASPANYYRFKVRGYFNSENNTVVWWDDEMIEYSSNNRLFTPNNDAMVAEADFNCPGGGVMMLDGNSKKKDDDNAKEFSLHLDKVDEPGFKDEWDWVIENYTLGANNPSVIDSVNSIFSSHPAEEPKDETVIVPPVKETKTIAKRAPVEIKKQDAVKKEPKKEIPRVIPDTKRDTVPVLTIEEKFQTRQKKLVTEIPLAGDSIELRFYDNAEIDGDSISLFLNGKLIFSHILLAAEAYIIKIPVTELTEQSELTMVAENLGRIPPNTSLMIAYVEGKRYEAMMESTNNSSAMIRFTKKLSP